MVKEKSCGAVVYKIENNNVLYLLVKHNKGHISFSKGHVEKGETEEMTAKREIKEETNLDGAVGDFYEAIQDDYVHKRTVQVVMYLKNITGDVSISDEHDEWMWANLEKIKTLELSTAFEKVLKKKNWKI